MRPTVLHDLRAHPDPDVLGDFYSSVLVPSFSPEELSPESDLSHGLARLDGVQLHALVAVDTQTGRAIGGVVATLFARSQVLLVAYLAVRPDLRQGGLGRHLVDQARLRWAGLEAKLILAEVHDPRYHASTDPWAWSRVQLYDEMGARALALPFVQPEVRRGAGRARHFLLLVFHAEPSVVTDVGAGSSVTASVLEDFVLDYYADAEGPSRADDGDLAWLVGRLRAGTAVPLLPLSRLDEVPRDPRSG